MRIVPMVGLLAAGVLLLTGCTAAPPEPRKPTPVPTKEVIDPGAAEREERFGLCLDATEINTIVYEADKALLAGEIDDATWITEIAEAKQRASDLANDVAHLPYYSPAFAEYADLINAIDETIPTASLGLDYAGGAPKLGDMCEEVGMGLGVINTEGG